MKPQKISNTSLEITDDTNTKQNKQKLSSEHQNDFKITQENH